LEIREAIQRLRKKGMRSGAQALSGAAELFVEVCASELKAMRETMITEGNGDAA
jgi:hypothetical protein